jgi:hypothetical protein
VGTPGEAGEFAFTLRVRDAHPDGPREAQAAFRWTIAAASPAALAVPAVAAAPTLDGRFDEPYWSLDQKIAKRTAGAPAKTASFAAVWVPNNDWQKGGTVYLAVKVLDGPAGKTPKDAVHLFIDGCHNRELIYNQDDTHFVVRRDGKTTSVKGKPNWFLKCAAAEIEGGYTLEIAVPRNYFIGAGNWLPMGPKAVYGFDLAVDEGDKELAQQTWRGTADNADDTSRFGSIVLMAPAQ